MLKLSRKTKETIEIFTPDGEIIEKICLQSSDNERAIFSTLYGSKVVRKKTAFNIYSGKVMIGYATLESCGPKRVSLGFEVNKQYTILRGELSNGDSTKREKE